MSRELLNSLIFKIDRVQSKTQLELNFHDLPIGLELRESFYKAFKAQFGHLESTTLKTNFSALRIFCVYLSQTHKSDSLNHLTLNELRDFVTWLAKSGRKNSTNQSILNIVRALLAYAVRNNTGDTIKAIDLDIVGFRREEPISANVVSSEARKKILKACHQEIEAAEIVLKKGQDAMAEAGNGNPSELGETLLSILNIGQGRYVKKEVIRKAAPKTLKKMTALGFRQVYAHLFLTHEQLFPFYLAIVAETGGNPEALHAVQRECFIPHPTKPDFVLFVWQKKRAHAEQFAGYSLKQERSAAGLVKRLKQLNENLIHQATSRDQDRLFIGMTSSNGAGRSCTQLLHILLGSFIKRHELEKFTFRELRRIIAEEEYLKNGDIEDVKFRLGHKRISTTQSYLTSPGIKLHHEKKIVKFSGMLFNSARSLSREKVLEPISDSKQAQTLFGFNCKDPYSGLAPGSQKGRVCDKFYGCSTCPGAIVVLDDPKLIARLICTADHLREEQKRAIAEGWGIRFHSLYEPTLKILEAEILPLLTPDMVSAARKLIVPTMPRLE